MIKIKKGIISFLFALLFLLGCNKVYAASAGISASSTSVTVGTRVTVSASISATETYSLKMSASGGSLSGTTNSADAFGEERSMTVLSATFVANTPGTYTISLSGSVAGSDLSKQNVNRSINITVTQPAPSPSPSTNPGGNTGGNGNQGGNNNNQGGTTAKDTNANLRSLGFEPKEYDTFIFNANTLEYRVSVPNEVASIKVYANASSSNASVSGAGTRNLQEGTNRINITVTAQAGNTKKYSIVVNRAVGSDGEVPPNVIDEPIDEETPEINGLSSFEIPEIELDKEFKTDIYEYIVKTKDEITKEWLEEIKGKIVYVATNESYTVDTIAEVIEEGKKGTITIIVKDGETEIAKYVVTFEKEEEQKPVVALVTDSNSSNTSLIDLTFKQKIYILMVIYGITLVAAIFFAISSYLKSKRLEEYDDEQEFEEDSDFDKMNKFYVGTDSNIVDEDNKKDDTPKIFEKEETAEDTAGEAISSFRRMNGYRNLRNTNRSSGRHF